MDRSVVTHRHQACVVWANELHVFDLSIVTAKVTNEFAGVREVHMNDGAVHRRKKLSSCRESTLAARSNTKVLELSNVITVQIHKPKFIWETYEYVKPRWVDGNGQNFCGEGLLTLHKIRVVVPKHDLAVFSARHNEWLSNAHVETCNGSGMKRLAHRVANIFICFGEVRVGQVQRVQLFVACDESQVFLRGGRCYAKRKHLGGLLIRA
mmetsp:Transcript_69894/g.81520  ORF Transcript_69894/g.81520 Transcript_69894/m.81520 type:complete len:209 (+) Transcript_69894:244-870(+)